MGDLFDIFDPDFDVDVPEPSPESREIQRIQLEQLRRQETEQLALRPFLLESLGLVEDIGELTPTQQAQIGRLETERAGLDTLTLEGLTPAQRRDIFGETDIGTIQRKFGPTAAERVRGFAGERATEIERQIGGITPTAALRRMTEEERRAGLTPSQLRQEEIFGLQQERQLLALKGELPLTEQFRQQKRSQFEQFKEAQARRGNIITGDTPEEAVAQSSPGIQALRQFRERFGIIEEAQRRGEITQGLGGLLATQQAIGGARGRQFQQQIAFPGRRAGFLTQLGQAQQPFQFQQALGFDAAQQTAANRAQFLSDIAQAAGTAAGACWVAEIIYGETHYNTHMARLYCKANPDNWFVKLYTKYGKKWVKILENNKWLIPIVKPIWDYMAFEGEMLCQMDVQQQ